LERSDSLSLRGEELRLGWFRWGSFSSDTEREGREHREEREKKYGRKIEKEELWNCRLET
jgi:hypothetical protein